MFDLDILGGQSPIDELVERIVDAGKVAVTLFQAGAATRARAKGDGSPVTEADHVVEERVRAAITQLWPDAAIIGEELGSKPGTSRVRFIIDPIDGTRAFIRGFTTWTTLVGVEVDGVPSVGIAHFPATGELYVGIRGHGARGNGKTLHVSDVANLREATVCHGSLEQFRLHGSMRVLEPVARSTDSQRGAPDFDGYRQVVEGRADAMLDPAVKPWDICAAAVIVREAGGRFTSFEGEDSIEAGSGLASNGAIHDALLAITRPEDPA